jgi:hypothetical protein
MYYNYESGDFLAPLTPALVGIEVYEQFISTINEPMDLQTIIEKMKVDSYITAQDFKRDVYLIFENCEAFNNEESDIVQSARSLKLFFEEKLAVYCL